MNGSLDSTKHNFTASTCQGDILPAPEMNQKRLLHIINMRNIGIYEKVANQEFDKNRLKDELVVVTGFSSNHFSEAEGLLKSVFLHFNTNLRVLA